MRISDWSSDVCSSDLHTINSATGNRVRSRYVDAETNRPVREDDEVRGYETEEGRHVVIEDEELEAVGLESTRTIDIDQFVPAESIYWVWYDPHSYAQPDDERSEGRCAAKECFTTCRFWWLAYN